MEGFKIDDIEEFLRPELDKICDELHSNGIVYEGQFECLWSMAFNYYGQEMREIFTRETQLDILYTYEVCYFAFYDVDRYSSTEVRRKIREYHSF